MGKEPHYLPCTHNVATQLKFLSSNPVRITSLQPGVSSAQSVHSVPEVAIAPVDLGSPHVRVSQNVGYFWGSH